MRRVLSLLLLLTLAHSAGAQETRYVSDKQYIPLRSGPGGNYRITHRGIPSGTQLVVKATDGDYSEIVTDKGTAGWIRTQYLMNSIPAQTQLDAATAKLANLTKERDALAAELANLKEERVGILNNANSTENQLSSVTEELVQLKQVSGKAVQLDIDNRRLIEDSENLRSQVETFEAENQRLQDKLKSEAFMNGALAVLLGVIITLVVPRLWPKRRKSSSWA